ncbi:unnamed protein product [Penicillium salamii]|uniref:Uncharacterized protein n=1 Tax=Penicillium salamii TaxID=1612424 RepID=A0A9W4JT33_9EURO|nr:unnamed protein product [Penicillium salamii]CAG7976167.1 unnamed protein product [Penicillium salamii]CAG7978792.1 unnamed protein product [Penicillium salamii]CAG8028896.1 unnamed protein product [Penicillium salamii]CAG8063849.1 unnamed protein product [Penicillium salamii]
MIFTTLQQQSNMTTSWPAHTLDDSKFEDVFQLAQKFELHCAQVYSHAATHPDSAPSADYVMQLVSQAYRAVHSLHMQKIASAYLDSGAAVAALETKAKEYRDASSNNDTHSVEAVEEETPQVPGAGLVDLLNGDFEDDEEEDSEWEESDEETDDEYYEYCEGSDSDSNSDLEELARTSRIDLSQPIQQNEMSNDAQAREPTYAPKTQTTIAKEETPPPVSIIQDQAMHDRITAALQNLTLPSEEPEDVPLTRVETYIDPSMTTCTMSPTHETHREPEDVPLTRVKTYIDPSMTTCAMSATHETHSEDSAVQIESHQEPKLEHFATAPAHNTTKSGAESVALHRKISMRSSPGGISRRLKTVCYKFAGRAMVPVRGKVN